MDLAARLIEYMPHQRLTVRRKGDMAWAEALDAQASFPRSCPYHNSHRPILRLQMQMLQAMSHPFFDELRQPGAGAPLVLPDLFSFTEEGWLPSAVGRALLPES